jgi:hypothetical protein
MTLTIDILMGFGLALAAGIRPFLPALVAGAASRADFFLDVGGTPFAFLEQTWWLALMAAATVAGLLLRDRIAASPPATAALAGISLGMGALLFAGALADDGYAWWPGIAAGLGAAWLSGAATRPLFARAGARLDEQAASHLPVYAEGVAGLLALLAVTVRPIAFVAVAFFAWLLAGSRRREGEKYAGLRSLR